MQIRPSIVGYFLKNYAAAIFAAIILIALSAAAPLAIKQIGIPVIFFSAGAGVLLITAAYTILYRQTTSLTLEEEKVSYETGILSHKVVSAPVRMITDSTITRSLVDKIIGTATLGINTSGSTAMEITAQDFCYSDVKKMNDEIYRQIGQAPQSLSGGRREAAHKKR